MNFNKDKIISNLSIIYVAFTLILNIIGYFTLPDTIATHFSLTGKVNGYSPTPVYLIVSFLIVGFISLRSFTMLGEQKLKYILVDTLIVVINAVVIISQIIA